MSKKKSETSDLISFKNSQGVKARGTLLKLSQNYIVFEVYNPYSIVQLSEVLSDLTITRADKQIYNGKAVVINIVNTGTILIVYATLSDSDWKSTIDIWSKTEIQQEIDHLISSFESQQKIDLNFKLSIISIRSFLSSAKNWIDKLEPVLEKSGTKMDDKFMFESFAIERAAKYPHSK